MFFKNIFFIFLFNFYDVNSQSVQVSNSSLSLTISPLNSNVQFLSSSSLLVIGLTNSPQVFSVTCTKTNPTSGTLVALVNSVALTQTSICNTYSITSTQQTVCTQIITSYTALVINGNLQLNFQCILNETKSSNTITYSTYQIVIDSQARIRSGLSTDLIGLLALHVVDSEQLSCEAVQDMSMTATFNSVGWLLSNNTNLNFSFSKIQLSSNLVNYTSTFNKSTSIQPGVIQCCTFLDNTPVKCQAMFATISSSLITTTTVTTSTSSTVNSVTSKSPSKFEIHKILKFIFHFNFFYYIIAL